MEAMRQSDLRLTMKTYTDAGQLPVRDAVLNLPDFLAVVPSPAGSAPTDNAQIDSHATDAEGHRGALAGTSEAKLVHAQGPWNQDKEHALAHSGANGHESEENARCRVRTCDFLRVKQALYH